MRKKVVLIILDGWGISPEQKMETSAIAKASTPFMDSICREKLHSLLKADGEAVGLREGQMGNSEVGHINLGAGRIVAQDLVRIDTAIQNRELHQNRILLDAFEVAKKENKQLHFMGLVSSGGVHSHIDHLKALCEITMENGLSNYFVHAFTDGRDTDPESGINFLEELQEHLQNTGGKLASITGRYFAMDRAGNLDRTSRTYRALVHGEATNKIDAGSWKKLLQEKYGNGQTDEFLEPVVLTEKGKPVTTMNPGDVVVFFNFRTDRGRQLTEALTQRDFPDYNMKKLDLRFITMTRYDPNYKDVAVLFKKENIINTLGEVLAKNQKTQLRLAETVKYPHVTYFFNGGREKEFEGEERILIKSPEVATFDKRPEMNAEGIRNAIIPKLKDAKVDFVCINFANPDMVGHTGNIEATKKACEITDACAGEVAKTAVKNGYAVVIIADHGNAEKMATPDGSPYTAHTTNPVPCVILGCDQEGPELKNGKLGDVAPSILFLMGIALPPEMTGEILLSSPN